MKLFLNYIRDNMTMLFMLVLFAVIFTTVFSLYSLPLSPILYGGGLCLFFAFFVFLYDFLGYRKKHKILCRLKGSLLGCIDELPYSGTLAESDYAALLFEFDALYRKTSREYDSARTEMLDFYTLWVHQIKTPIAAMSLLLQENRSEQNTKLLQELFKIEQYAELVLGYLRIENISSDLNFRRHALEDIVRQAVKKYAPVFIHKKISLELCALEATVLTDDKWLLLVIEQLLSNALKYTSKGSIKIYCQQSHTLHEGDSSVNRPVQLVIEDSGIGIAAEDLPRVFERGFTGFNGRMDKKSTGLGLYLCKKTADKLRHKIAITSECGRGTKVSISFAPDSVSPLTDTAVIHPF